jgi:hypothetical protein
MNEIIITPEMLLEVLRINRNTILDTVFKYNQWIYDRYNREIRLGITPTSNTTDEIYELDFYIQELCDLPEKYKNLTSLSEVVYPTPPSFVRGL